MNPYEYGELTLLQNIISIWRYGRCYPSYEDYLDEIMEYKLDEAKAMEIEKELEEIKMEMEENE